MEAFFFCVSLRLRHIQNKSRTDKDLSIICQRSDYSLHFEQHRKYDTTTTACNFDFAHDVYKAFNPAAAGLAKGDLPAADCRNQHDADLRLQADQCGLHPIPGNGATDRSFVIGVSWLLWAMDNSLLSLISQLFYETPFNQTNQTTKPIVTSVKLKLYFFTHYK